MDMIATAKLTAAAAILAATSSPAFARGERSADNLPSFQRSSQIAAFRAPSSNFSSQFSANRSFSGSSNSLSQSSSAFVASPSAAFGASNASTSAFGSSGGLGALLSRFLPPRIVERLRVIANRDGPGGELICGIFGFSGCDTPDSPG